MKAELNEKIETLKDMIGSRVAYLEIVKALDPGEDEKNFLLRASVEVRKTEPDTDVINRAYQILVGEEDVQEDRSDDSRAENTILDQKEEPEEEQIGIGHIYCPNCGARLDAGVKFCNKCGTKIIINKPVKTPDPKKHEVQQKYADKGNAFERYFINVIRSKYAKFSGVASRTEYWFYALFYFLILLGIILVVSFISPELAAIVASLYFLGLVVPTIAMGVRRLHDINLSGWFYLITLIPYIGGLIMFILAVLPTKHDSKYR